MSSWTVQITPFRILSRTGHGIEVKGRYTVRCISHESSLLLSLPCMEKWTTDKHSTQSWHKAWPYELMKSLWFSYPSNTTKVIHQKQGFCREQAQMSVLQQCSETMPDTDQASGQRYLVMAGEDAMGLSPHNFIRAAGRGASEAHL